MADQQMREALNCIRCGACLNACPVYRKVGGHAYGWVYSGPIGAVVSPMLTNIKDSKDLPFASSLCGACHEACPVNINIPRMLLHLRKELTEGETHPEAKSAPVWERLTMKGWRLSVASPVMMGWANRLGRLAQAPFLKGDRPPVAPTARLGLDSVPHLSASVLGAVPESLAEIPGQAEIGTSRVPAAMNDKSSRDRFLANVRRALGRSDARSRPPQDSPFPGKSEVGGPTVEAVRREMDDRADELLEQLAQSASDIGWQVERAASAEAALDYIVDVARSLEAKSAMRSAHPVLDGLDFESRFSAIGVELELMAVHESRGDLERQRADLREKVVRAELGITGVDYAIAETGSCVIVAKKGVSRLVSLLPPAYIAVVRRGEVLPSLDELFVLRRQYLLAHEGASYMNIISGPSRSADIEQTIVRGVHGPGNVHMVLLG